MSLFFLKILSYSSLKTSSIFPHHDGAPLLASKLLVAPSTGLFCILSVIRHHNWTFELAAMRAMSAAQSVPMYLKLAKRIELFGSKKIESETCQQS
jgi:hypothetical protein